MSARSFWKYVELKPGSFGYENMATSIGYMFDKMEKGCDIYKCAALVHDGWVINYLFWRDNLPASKHVGIYFAPAKKLGDARRDHCAATKYEDLEDEEQEKDYVIADAALELLCK